MVPVLLGTGEGGGLARTLALGSWWCTWVKVVVTTEVNGPVGMVLTIRLVKTLDKTRIVSNDTPEGLIVRNGGAGQRDGAGLRSVLLFYASC